MENKFDNIPIDPDPVNGRKIRNSVNSEGIPNTLKIGSASFEIMIETPLKERSSTTANIATK